MVGEVFGANLRQMREARGWSQSELARRMREEAGWKKYSQMGVSRTEDNLRSVRLDEAVALASVLGVSVERLLTGEPVRKEILILEESAQALIDAWKGTIEAVASLVATREELASLLDAPLPETKFTARVANLRKVVEQTYATCTVYGAVQGGVLDFIEDGPGRDDPVSWITERGGPYEVVRHFTGIERPREDGSEPLTRSPLR